MDQLSEKIVDSFKGKVVRKDLTGKMKRGANVPGYVIEYLLGVYCATDNEETIEVGMNKIKNILDKNYVKPEEVEKLKSIIREAGTYSIIDKLECYLDTERDLYIGSFVNFNIGEFVLDHTYAIKYPKLFMGGVWCMAKLKYEKINNDESEADTEFLAPILERKMSPRKKKKKDFKSFESNPFSLVNFKPIEIASFDFDELIKARENFTLQEWISFILRSVGVDDTYLNDKEKMHFLERLVPLFEKNYNLVELGPRGTGKSHIYKEISPYSILISGGQSSISNLFYNLRMRQVGLVGHWDTIAFDEIAGLKSYNYTTLQILKDYMASGSFVRGTESINADASLVFIGNINDSVQNILKVSHLFSPFPNLVKDDAAFFDRIHYYLPGWEVPKIKSDILTESFGFISDYFAEFAKYMRSYDWSHELDSYFKFNKKFNIRDEIAVRKTVSGLLKILYPNKEFDKQGIEIVLNYALEGRRRVKEQLRKMIGEEFCDIELGYINQDGLETIVDLPEKTESTIIPQQELPIGHIYTIGRSLTEDRDCAVYKLETRVIPGSGRIEIQGIGRNAEVKDSLNAAWLYFLEKGNQVKNFHGTFTRDYLIYVNDIQNRYLSDEISLAEFISLVSISTNIPVMDSLAVVGNITISGTFTELHNIKDYVRFAYNAGAKNILLPISMKTEFENIKDEDLMTINPIYYQSAVDACKKALQII